MPAGENTKYNQMTLHRVFGCSALVMLIATIWMFAADHYREWKGYQRENRRIETTLTEWRRDAQLSLDVTAKINELHEQLQAELAAAPDKAAFDAFVSTLHESEESLKGSLIGMYDAFGDDSDANAANRVKLMARVEKTVKRAKDTEKKISGERKFAAAEFDKVRADYDIGIRDSYPEERLAELRQIVAEQRKVRDELTIETQAQTDYRIKLQQAQAGMLASEAAIRTQLDDAQADYNRLATAANERRSNLGKSFLELPIFDAFGGPLKPDNRWTKGLTRTNGSFGQVTRFDRCTTCHQNMEKTQPGSAIKPAYESEHEIQIQLTLPEEKPTDIADSDKPLLAVYGLELADKGLVHPNDVTIRNVIAESIAAKSPVVASEIGVENEAVGLQPGDVITFINADEIQAPINVEQQLLGPAAPWGQSLTLIVRRGLPHPFSTHPRLDLFVGSLSPHKLATFGCSICHEGQGSATQFKWVSHTPNNPEQGEEWTKEHGWFNNHHWIYPMFPKRFAESSCLKCHHEVVELAASPKFPDGPAPKLMHGYDLISSYGCFGCHEINGYKGPDRIGPDLRLEPNYFAAAAQVKADDAFTSLPGDVQGYVETLIKHPELDDVRHKLREFITDDAKADEPTLTAVSHKMGSVLDDVDYPGQLTKVGPSLRYVGSKVGKKFLFDWIRDPQNFRKSTKMPRFFGHWDHLQSDPAALELAKRYEPVEILGITEYLLTTSQQMDAIDAPVLDEDWEDPEMVERGKLAFELRGCLNCHQHADFPNAKDDQGPNLTGIGDKFAVDDTPSAKRWLYTWLKSPTNYHARTKMPNLYLDPIEQADGTVVDPAADIAAYLLSDKHGWEPGEQTREHLGVNQDDLKALVLEHLKTKMYTRQAEDAVEAGQIPERVATTLKGAEAELASGELSTERMLHYIGQKSIAKYGCYACHDVVGFEDAKPIGAALADWGLKDSSKLAFEHIAEYLHHGHGNHGVGAGSHDSAESNGDHDADDEESHEGDGESHDQTGAHVADDFDESFYMEKMHHHEREGFIWQKLKEPRSYDYEKASSKDSYNDRLRMPLFPFTNQEREAVITFVLGLVAEPPASQFVYKPDDRAAAMIAGKKVLDKYNCAGCHLLEPETWTVTAEPGAIEVSQSDPESSYPFMIPSYPSADLAASAEADKFHGTITGEFHGMPQLDSATGLVQVLDEDGAPLTEEDLEDPELDPATFLHMFDVWKPSLFDGQIADVGTPVEIPATAIVKKRASVGGDFAKMLLPRVTEVEKEVNPGADAKQAWGWLPPPLIDQGVKVQADWMHDFLLEPYRIRPATFMRMPNFNMSSKEASALVNYFAARDGATYPYDHSSRTDVVRLDEKQDAYEAKLAETDVKPNGTGRFAHAMNIVTSSDYCVQCHIVGSYAPKTSDRAKAPNLALIEKRLRPDYLRRWIANPKQVLPYTPMPVNVKYPTGVAQELYHGTSVEQLDALVDLLMNYSRYTESRADIADMVKPATTGETAPSSGETASN
ncbi:MAG: hypothetical protein KDB27_31000 [Planctomycetales bacterium]|nr:hypothetical protein [Planctomycetales bacterium]